MSSIFNKKYISITYGKYNKSNYVEKLCKYLFKNSDSKLKLLDIGCGNCEITNQLVNLGYCVYGLDYYNHDTNRPSLGWQLNLCDLEKQSYPFEDNFFDIVFCKSTIEHLRNPDILVDQAFRMLKKGGVFICMTPSWKHSYKEQFYVDHTHVTPFTQYSLKMICMLSGFVNIKCSYFYQLPLLWRFKWLILFVKFLNLFNLPYRPFYEKAIWSEKINIIIRFSKEPMLLCTCKKP